MSRLSIMAHTERRANPHSLWGSASSLPYLNSSTRVIFPPLAVRKCIENPAAYSLYGQSQSSQGKPYL